MAEMYPNARIDAITNSIRQKEYIEKVAQERSLNNLQIILCDMNDFRPKDIYQRVVSVEMFEHMRNYHELLKKISEGLAQEGKLFVHIFVHKRFAYKFEVKDSSDWMSKHFFTGGMMPSDDLLFYFQNHLKIEQHWRISGTHYQKTAEAWMNNMKRNKEKIMEHLSAIYGKEQAQKWWVYWKIFFMSCAELWGYDKGREWFVSHYLFHKAG
jgi:cyclopropane-fatty-acyl-phospholipid synthase